MSGLILTHAEAWKALNKGTQLVAWAQTKQGNTPIRVLTKSFTIAPTKRDLLIFNKAYSHFTYYTK